MVQLLNDGDNKLTQVKLTNAITAGLVIKVAKKRADKLLTTTGKNRLPYLHCMNGGTGGS
jgi:hypothetical protein